jgi:hypothetical protein
MGLSDLAEFEDPATWSLPAQQIDCLWVAGEQEHLVAIGQAPDGMARLSCTPRVEIGDDII